MLGNKVFVTGIGCITAAGSTITEFWNHIANGVSAIQQISTFDISSFETKIGAQVKDIPYANGTSQRKINRLGRSTLMAMYSADQAIKDANLQVNHLLTAGVFIGSSQGGFTESESFFKEYFASGHTSPFGILKPMNSAPASQISIEQKIHGPVITIDTACSSANHAIGIAMNMVRWGLLDIAIVGGTDTVFSPAVFKSWCALKALSKDNDHPERACKPFSANRDGTVLGEGAGMLILESEDSMRSRSGKAYAEIAGYGFSADAFHITQTNSDSSAIAIKNAIYDAKWDISDVDYINAHATATVTNDKTETEAIKKVFKDQAYKIPISGIKPIVGHTLAASAALELIACVLIIKNQLIPPTINVEEYDPNCDLDYVTNTARNCRVNRCISSSFGFGGSNSVIAIDSITI